MNIIRVYTWLHRNYYSLIKVLTPTVIAALDRTLTTDNNAATTVSLGHDLRDIVWRASTIHTTRLEFRAEKMSAICIKSYRPFWCGLETNHLLDVPKLEYTQGVEFTWSCERDVFWYYNCKHRYTMRILYQQIIIVMNQKKKIKKNNTVYFQEKRMGPPSWLTWKTRRRYLLYFPCRYHIGNIIWNIIWIWFSSRGEETSKTPLINELMNLFIPKFFLISSPGKLSTILKIWWTSNPRVWPQCMP